VRAARRRQPPAPSIRYRSQRCPGALLKSAWCLADGGLYTATPIDPLFLLLPVLEKSRQRVGTTQRSPMLATCTRRPTAQLQRLATHRRSLLGCLPAHPCHAPHPCQANM
jgi:hypothetical protein